MQIILRQLEDVALLDLKGAVHCDDGDSELEAIIKDLTNRGCIKLVINLREVTHIDSTCLGVLIAAQVRFRLRCGGLNLLQVPPQIQRLLTTTRIGPFLPTSATEEEAIRSLATAGVPDRGDGPPTNRSETTSGRMIASNGG